MKHLIKGVFGVLVMSLLLASCGKEEEANNPELSDPVAKYIGGDFAVVSTEILSKADQYIKERGICWNTEADPTIDANKVKYEKTYDEYQCEIEDLAEGTTYYAKAYVKTELGTTYSSEISFTTTSPITDEDGNSYSTVIIGNQTWMAENLKTTKFNDGSSITNVTDNDAWTKLESAAYSWWENDPSKSNRGAYYNYYTVATGNLAPTGWHVPSEEEWNTLVEFVGEKPGDKLKYGTFSDRYFNGNAESGFKAQLEGYRASGSGTFGRPGEWTFFWYLDPNASNSYTYAMRFEDDSPSVVKDFNSMQMGFSVRCIKD